MLTRLGVAGWPVGHSRSPAMHNAALAALELHDWRYQHLPVPPGRFAETVRALEGAGFRGINVTIPHKETAIALADDVTPTARAVGAANTLTLRDGGVSADNTDVTGLLHAMGAERPRGRTCLVLGAGGAGRAATYALLHAGAAEVLVWNRTPERAAALCAEIGGTPVEEADIAAAAPEVIVHCTSVGLQSGETPFKRLPLTADTFAAGNCVVDMVYRANGTSFLAAARSRGADVVDGLDVLVGQGAAALEQWIGRPVPRDVMRRAVKDPSTA